MRCHFVGLVLAFAALPPAGAIAEDGAATPPRVAAQPSPEYEALFRREQGWTGADCAYSLMLSQDRSLWLYGDTWVGEIRDGRHVRSTMVNNSVAILRGRDPAAASVDYFYGKAADGKPAALITPADGRGFFWLISGIRAPQGLFLLAPQIEKIEGRSDAFAFRQVGQWLIRVTNPDDRPTLWRNEQQKLPFFRVSTEGTTTLGAALLVHQGLVYVYGYDEEITKPIHVKHMIVARVPERDLGRLDQWRFYAGGPWQPELKQAARLVAHVASEYSVSYQPGLKKFVAVYTPDGLAGKIALRTASSPVGPWSDPVVVYQCPEMQWHKTIFCYAAKAHPELARSPDELIITYVASSTDFWYGAGDARLYWPRFVRVKFRP